MFRFLAGLGLLWGALLLPVWIGSLSPYVMEGLGRGSPQLHDLARLAKEEGRDGRMVLFTAALEKTPLLETVADPVAGPHGFARSLLTVPRGKASPSTFADPFLSRSGRNHALRLLGELPRRDVERLLELREETAWQRLPPATEPGGVLTDIPLITLAALMAEGAIRAEFAVTWLQWQEDTSGIGRNRIEEFFLGLLALSRHLNFDQIAALSEVARSPEALVQLASLLQLFPEEKPLIFSLAVLSGDAGLLVKTVGGSRDQLDGLRFFLPLGQEALRHRLISDRPLHHPPGWMAYLLRPLERYPLSPGFSQNVNRFTGALISLKMLLFFVGLTLIFAGIGRLRSGRARSQPNPRLAAEARWVASALGSLALFIPAWVIIEPQLLRSPPEALPSTALPLNLSSILPSTDTMNIDDLFVDPISLIMLGLFFLLQLIIYFFCLIKLAEIRRQSLAPAIKIALLENEDNLFDSGLYLGLGGTVLSLILLAVGVLEASLMAAYASTLFGIIFVSALKIFHVRPFRRRLILSE